MGMEPSSLRASLHPACPVLTVEGSLRAVAVDALEDFHIENLADRVVNGGLCGHFAYTSSPTVPGAGAAWWGVACKSIVS